jgi:hypothetical protein
MWHFLMLAMACACLAASPAQAAPKTKGPPLDPFKACGLQVRSDLREGGTWLIPQNIRLDEGRLILTVTFADESPSDRYQSCCTARPMRKNGGSCAATSKK